MRSVPRSVTSEVSIPTSIPEENVPASAPAGECIPASIPETDGRLQMAEEKEGENKEN